MITSVPLEPAVILPSKDLAVTTTFAGSPVVSPSHLAVVPTIANYAYASGTNVEFVNERTRLNLFSPLHLDRSLKFLEEQGIQSATSFADIGCGTAYLDKALVERYPKLMITALDKDTSHIAANKMEYQNQYPTLKFLEADLLNPPIELLESFDMANATLLMAHMQKPVAALKDMASLLKLGGKLTVEEVDVSKVSANKPFPALDRYRELWKKMILKVKGDAEIGPKLESYFREAGLSQVKSSHYEVYEPQDAIKEMILRVVNKPSIRNLIESIVAEEERLIPDLVRENVNQFIRDLEIGFADPGMHVRFYDMYQVAGTKR